MSDTRAAGLRISCPRVECACAPSAFGCIQQNYVLKYTAARALCRRNSR